MAWVDAHGDFNTPETTLTGYLGGMPLACVAGYGLEELRAASGLTPVPPRQIVLLGPRDLDPAEERLIAESGATLIRPLEVPASDALTAALERLDQLPQVYLHIDIDVLDPSVAAGWNYQVPGGLQLADLEQLVAEVLAGENVAALSLTALNPERDDADGRAVAAALRLVERIVTYLAQG